MSRIDDYLAEDVGYGDITSDALIYDEIGTASIKAGQACVLAGLEEAKEVFEHLGLSTTTDHIDGENIAAGVFVISVKGRFKDILLGERLALNFLMRMSGIATMTSSALDICREKNPRIRIAATRKTTPGFRYYEKKAVMIGGGDPHRFRLDDAILIKDNHIAVVGSIEEAIKRSRSVSFTKKIEIEVVSLKDAEAAARSGADIVLLDNMSPNEAMECSDRIRNIDPRIIIEASGNMDIRTAPAYAPYVDVISMGCLTHSARSIQFSLDVIDVHQPSLHK